MSSNRKRWSDIRKAGETSGSTLTEDVKTALQGVSVTTYGASIEAYLSWILLDVCPNNTLEAMLEDRGRKALARELLTMMQKDENHVSKEP